MDTNVNVPSFADSSASVVTGESFAGFKAEKQISFIRNYDPKVAMVEGYRHAVIRYRKTEKQTAIKTPKMVTIPVVSLPEEFQLLPTKALEVFRGVIEDQQDTIIGALIDSGVSLVEWSSVTLDACLETLTATRVSQRLTKEQIEGWARIALKEAMAIRGRQNAEGKGVTDPKVIAIQIAATSNKYVEFYSRLAAPVPNLGQQEAIALNNLLLQSLCDDDIAKTLKKKLHAIMNPAVLDSGDL